MTGHMTDIDIRALERLHKRKTTLMEKDEELSRAEMNELRRINRQIAAYAEYQKAELEALEEDTAEDAKEDDTPLPRRTGGPLYYLSLLIMKIRNYLKRGHEND